ncbi:MAG: family 43 glycosylhydrolase [Acidimicrobiales bacterium]|nr:family 43 glycosylhydrolase [Acidimicrobiales bacterium]
MSDRPSVVSGEFAHIYDPSVGEREQWYVNDHTFICDRDGRWHLIGITHPEPFKPFEEIDQCHATAPSLLGPWTKQPACLTADAAWGEKHLWAPHVIEHDGLYWMFFCGGSLEGGDRYRLHLATSEDCVTWTRHPDNPLVVDGFEARDPMVTRVGDRWVMYYTGNSEPHGGNHCVLAAESDDLVHWSGRTIVYRDELVGTGGGGTESPFVVQRDGTWYLFIGPADIGEAMRRQAVGEKVQWALSYSSTIVLASDDPLHFDRADEVGYITSHAAEVIVDEHGNDWISHCGWGQAGVYLAPLRFDGPRNAPRSANPMARAPLPR